MADKGADLESELPKPLIAGRYSRRIGGGKFWTYLVPSQPPHSVTVRERILGLMDLKSNPVNDTSYALMFLTESVPQSFFQGILYMFFTNWSHLYYL